MRLRPKCDQKHRILFYVFSFSSDRSTCKLECWEQQSQEDMDIIYAAREIKPYLAYHTKHSLLGHHPLLPLIRALWSNLLSYLKCSCWEIQELTWSIVIKPKVSGVWIGIQSLFEIVITLSRWQFKIFFI
jgi:hypothetical protein